MRDYMNEIFSDQGIEELRQRLGLGNQSVSEEDLELDSSLGDDVIATAVVDQNQSIAIPPPTEKPRLVTQQVGVSIQSDSISSEGSVGIDFPKNITMPGSLITYRVGPDGATVADIVVQFDDVDGASDYSVRFVSQT